MTPAESAAVLLAAGLAITAAAWPTRRWPRKRRAIALALAGALLLALPFAQPRTHLALQIIVVTNLMLLAFKLLDLHVGAAWWRQQRLRTWLFFVLVVLILVMRRYVEERKRPRRASALLFLRGALEVAAGVLLLRWAGDAGLGAQSFWLEHLVKVLAAYLCAFDGGLVLLCATLRLLGLHVMDYSREPIIARTPADFWRRYNREAGRMLHENVYLRVGGRRHPGRGTLAAFLVNGLLHEYLASLLVGRVQGYQLAFFGLHAVAVIITFRLRPRGLPAAFGVLATFLFLVASSALFFATVDAVDAGWFYPDGGLLR